MASFDHIQRCFSLGDDEMKQAVVSRSTTKALLDHLVGIAKPNEGAPKILLVFARMATSACDWLDGELRVEVLGDGEICVIEVMTELGGGLRERALPSMAVSVPLSEFVRAVDRVPRMVEPLVVKTKTDRRLVLVSKPERAGRSLPPVPVAIAEEHLVELPRPASLVASRPAAPRPLVPRPPVPRPAKK
jgi:hypothetical protein